LARLPGHIEEAAGVLLLGVMALFAFVNVITRYFIHYSFASSEEIEVACLVWLTMFGAAAGFRRGIHLGFNLLSLKFPLFGRKVLAPFGTLLTAFTVATLIYYSIFQIRDEILLSVKSEALNLPQWIYTLAIPVGGILLLVRLAESAWKEVKGARD
jgi:TRAP-type C4-dicarboxylate transport system permease small subunit